MPYHTHIQKVLSEGFQLFSDDEGEKIQISSSARQRKAILMVFPWWPDDGPSLKAGSVAL